MATKRKSAAKRKAATKKRKGGGLKKASMKKGSLKKAENGNEEEVVVKKATRKRAPRVRRKAVEQPSIAELTLQDIEEEEYSKEEFNKMLAEYEATIKDIKEGEIIKGRVLQITRDDVIVDVGFKSEGAIPIDEFQSPEDIAIGEEIDVYLDAIEDQDGQLVLSKLKADFMRVWDNIKEAYNNDELVRGKLVRRIKGGIVVDLLGVDAFLPGSQIALRQIPNFDEILGKEMQFKIIKLNKNRRNIVVSRRAVLEEERRELREKIISEIEPGQIREGIVKNITDFGVFIDLGGVDGLLHITDMSWGRISHPSELVSLGDTINVKILDFDKETGRISLGLKQLTPYPWEDIETKYPIGSRTKGKVVSITDYGAFVELEKGVEGLIHISEMSWTQTIKHPSRIMQVGDEIEIVVLSVDRENEKISLGIKQLKPDPWETLDQHYPPGTRVTGKVRNLTTFGAFVEIEDGIDGLVHISDMSWTKRIQHPSEIMKKGDVIDVVVLSIDKENRRVSLGRKQLEGDPWPALAVKYAQGVETKGRITRLLDRGVIVELEDEVEGFVPINHLAKPDIHQPSEAFRLNDELPLKVIEFDQHNRKIVLSVSAYYRNREEEEVNKYIAAHPTYSTKMSDVVEEAPTPSQDDQTKESLEETSEETPDEITESTESLKRDGSESESADTSSEVKTEESTESKGSAETDAQSETEDEVAADTETEAKTESDERNEFTEQPASISDSPETESTPEEGKSDEVSDETENEDKTE